MGKAREKSAQKAPNSQSKDAPSKKGSQIPLVVAALVLLAALAAAFFLRPRSEESQSSEGASPAQGAKDAVGKPRPRPRPKKASNHGQLEPNEVKDTSLPWEPKTLSVVLPCAGEGQFAKKTVQSVAKSVPGGIGGGILKEIIVVDDGSKPPLSQKFLSPAFQEKYPFKLVRHEKAVGLMGAKSAGAAVASGDVIVFFDCHVAPQDNWYEVFLESIAQNYRRIVVPKITDLNIDTWKEQNRGAGLAKCYMTWDADFKWINSVSPYMPVLSGGLLGISRRWWNETGGYDPGMSGWGGENVDQSLRSWLCGGEIVALPNAFVAHMWRKPEDPRTNQNYAVSNLDAIKNKARAVLGWFGNYAEKAAEYPAMSYVGLGSKTPNPSVGMNFDVSHFDEIRDRLSCRPFAWFLWRFRDIYLDGGMLPPETFELRDESTGNCLTYLGAMGTAPTGQGHVALMPCGQKLSFGQQHPKAQRWHPRNKDPATGKCCSAIGSWNTDQCLGGPGQDGLLGTFVCDVSGNQGAPWRLSEEGDRAGLAPGQLVYANQKCLVADKKAEKLQIGQGIWSYKMKFASCKKGDGKARWTRQAIEVPLETELYRKALAENPEAFTEN